MKKIPTVFLLDREGKRLARNEVHPDAQWVIAGEGVATRKWDGTCCMIRNGQLFKRCEIKRGGRALANFEPANDVDPKTGKQQGWCRLAMARKISITARRWRVARIFPTARMS